MRDGIKLNCQINESGQKIWLIVTHGLGEHSGRHRYLIDMFSQTFNILHYDLRGHGLSEGKRAHIEDFSNFYTDLTDLIQFLKTEFKMERYFLFGHSMGGLIVSGFMQKNASLDLYPEKVFLSAPFMAADNFLGSLLAKLPPIFSEILSSIPYGLYLKDVVDLKKLSHDGRVFKDYLNDPNNCLEIHTQLIFKMINEANEVFSRPLRISCALYCAYGSADTIVDVKQIYEFFGSVDKSAVLKEINEGYHELHNEIREYREPYFEFLKKSLLSEVFKNPNFS